MADKTKGSKVTIKQGTATKPSDYYGPSHGVAHQPEGPTPFAVNGSNDTSGVPTKGLHTLDKHTGSAKSKITSNATPPSRG